ncbi:glycoside hydrolase family 31 protein [Solitalea lacus]|uniref:glycoside hydrolase family 31 protein n=1 Tax=Solitalea lacus TaxID=2911172 RepID=UPI001EDAD998|nr:glycoside hydrolase family 31 protein [Solitalea lacus]UKJ09349.1 glycoside hydrolase family 31 protein [Solitalea lacus]
MENLTNINNLIDPDLKLKENQHTEEGEKFLNNPIVTVGPVTKQYLRSVKSYVTDGNRFVFSDGVSKVQISVISDEIIRVRMAPQGTFLADFSYAINGYPHKITLVKFAEDENIYKISTPKVNCIITKADFLISFTDSNNHMMNADAKAMHFEENVQFGGYYVYCSKVCTNTEDFYALGDKPTEFNLRGKRLVLWNTDTYAFAKNQDPLYRSIPFYIGLNEGKSYGIFFDNTFKTHFDFAVELKDRSSFWSDGGELNYYYIHGPEMMDVVKRYSQLTGTHQMPPMWALGFHQCRWSYYPDSKVKEIAQTFRDKKIPCDAIYLDIDYMNGYRCFTWNQRYFPEPKKLLGDLKDIGFKTVVIIDPGIKVDDNYWVFKEGKSNNYFCRRSDDYFMEGNVWPGRCQFPDFTNPKVRDWWGWLFKELLETGVDGIWNDMNEPAVFGSGTFPDDVRHNFDHHRGSHRKAHNVYGMQMVRATYEGLKKLQKNKRPFTITRAGYSGVQRYSSVWTGDNVATWEHLKLANIMCQRLSISGISFCGTDIGGFTGEPDGELFTRWIQLGVFTPLMRAHSAGDTREREPWSFGEPFEGICRKFIELRYKLMPYLYSAFWQHYKYQLPVVRPIVMLESHEHINHYREDEFSFGDNILVCPVLQPSIHNRKVYLPQGAWYDYWTNQKYSGGKEFVISTPLDSMPIFVKAGAVIPEMEVMQYTDEFELEELFLKTWFSVHPVKSVLYEDHGDTFAYQQDIFLEKTFNVFGSNGSLIIEQVMDGLYTPRYEKYRHIIYGLPFKVSKVLIDGKEQKKYSLDTRNVLEFSSSKKFKKIEILA